MLRSSLRCHVMYECIKVYGGPLTPTVFITQPLIRVLTVQDDNYYYYYIIIKN